MLHRPLSLTLSIGLAWLSLATTPGPAPADVYFETAYLPTTSIIGTSPGILSTSYVVPTAYSTTYLPTSYLSTSSIISSDSVVYPTSTTVLRRSLFRPRRYVERTYYSYPLTSTSFALPTSYVLPTTYLAGSSLLPTTYVTRSYVAPTSYLIDDGVITTSASSSSYPCDTTQTNPVRATAIRPSNNNGGDSGGTITSVPSNGGSGNERRPQATLNSSAAAGEEAPSSAVNPQPPKEIPPVATTPPGKTETPPPPQPLDEPKPEDLKMPQPGETGKPQAKPGETTYRSARRPNYDGRNILRGRVISAESRRPEEGVTVIISNVTKAYSDRPAMTDADGEFKVSLPDGDWTVKVKMPSGSVYAVGRDYVTASGGRVTDSSGRNVADFLITR